MTKIGTVTRVIDASWAEVTVPRESACGHDCEQCPGCGAQGGGLTVRAKSSFLVEQGDRVELYSDNKVLGYAALVYLVPVILFFAGYFLFPNFREGLRCLSGCAGFALGIGVAVVFDRRAGQKKALTHEIIRKI